MTIILLWIVTSAAIGWFGRKRVIGFWGFFVLSLLVSPIVTSLFLLVAAPGKRYVAETEQRVAESLRRTGLAVAPPRPGQTNGVVDPVVAHARTPGMRWLMVGWLATTAVFAGLYLMVGGSDAELSLTTGSWGLLDAVRLSFDVGTLGSGRDDIAASSAVTWLASLQRLVVLVILVLMVSSLISARLAALRAKEHGNGAAARIPRPAAVEDAPSV